VGRGPDPDDRRGVLVRATAKGSRVLHRGRRRRVDVLASGLRTLSDTDLAAVARGAELIERITRGT
jgi:DNA-binding MarR family transcriptional regulator